MFSEGILLNILKFILSRRKLLQLRKLNQLTKGLIDDNFPVVQKLISFYHMIQKKLVYNEDIYDQYTYKRKIIKNAVGQIISGYQKIQIPFIDYCHEDMDGISGEKISFIGNYNLPSEFYIFLKEYHKNPTVYVKLYYPIFINKILSQHRSFLREKFKDIIGSKPIINNIIFLTPLCYSKHFPANFKDKQYITVLLHINVIDEKLVQTYSGNTDRFFTLIFETSSLEDDKKTNNDLIKYLEEITASISTENTKDKMPEFCYAHDILNNTQSFDKCFDTLIQNQHFNL